VDRTAGSAADLHLLWWRRCLSPSWAVSAFTACPRTSSPPSTSPSLNIKLNGSPDVVEAFNQIPIKTVNGIPVYMKDVARVRDGYAVQTNVVRRDGRCAVLMTILKGEGASTLSVVSSR
jgi:multidrug efflux pump subunit AcrB